MIIKPEQLEGKPKKVGTLDGKDIYHAMTKGGLSFILKKDGKLVSMGPHPCVSRHIAKKQNKDIVWTDLQKDWVDPTHFEHVLPRYEEMTADFQKVQSKE